MLKVLFACGGTAGHINPALAVASTIRSHHPDAKILFAGNPKGMESRLVPKAGFDFAPIEIMGFQRQFNWRNIKYNITSAGCLLTCGPKAKRIIESFDPDVVVGTGGYVSGPILRKAHQMGYPTVTHEQNAFPGVTTKLISKTADKVLLAVEEAHTHLDPSTPYIVTGNPIRQEMLFQNRQQAREKLGVGDRICLVTFGGSLGAQRINECVADLVAWHYKENRIHHIHATGSYGTQLFPKLLAEKGVDITGNPHIDIREYIDNMPECLAAADLVICRAGAITLSELQAMGRASILIPSPNVAANHQYFNAMVLQEHGAAVVIEEKDLTGQRLCQEVKALIQDPDRLAQLGRNAQSMAILDANERIYQEILSLLGQK